MLRALAALVALALLAAPALADVNVNQPACPGAPPKVVFKDGLDRLENLLFDGAGHLFVTSIDGELRRFTADGAMAVLHEGDVPLGGLALGPDGALYVGHGVGPPLLAKPGSLTTEVWRFGSLDPPAHETYSAGLPSSNGLVFDDAGFLYVGGGFDASLWRIPPGGGAPVAWATAFGPNGLDLTPEHDAIYAALTGDPSSSIVRIAIDDPSDQETVAQLSLAATTFAPVGANVPPEVPAVVPKGLDDLTVGPDGLLYVTAHVTGEVLRVDPATGAACVLASGFRETSSARFARGFGAYDGDLFVTEFGGKITVLPVP